MHLLDGHNVVESTNGQEAVDVIEMDRKFDVILMDIQYVYLLFRPVEGSWSCRMPILNGFEATEQIRKYEQEHPLERKPSQPRKPEESNTRIPVFAVSTSLYENQRDSMLQCGLDGWILKPVDFKRMRTILTGIDDFAQRAKDVWRAGCSWEAGGWLHNPDSK